MRARFWRWLLVLLLLPPLSLAAVLGLAGSEAGTRWLLARALGAGGGEYTVASLSGTLLTRLQVRELRWHSGPRRLQVDHALVAWTPAELLGGLLHVQRLELHGIRYQGPAPVDEPSATELPSLPRLPFAVRVDAAEIEDLRVVTGGEPFVLQSVVLASSMAGNRLRLDRLAVRAPAWQVQGEGEVGGSAPHPLRLQFSWTATVEGIGELRADARVQGDMHALTVHHQLDAPFASTFSGQVELTGASPRVSLHGEWQPLRFVLDGDEWRSTGGSLAIEGSNEDFRLQLAGALAGPGIAVERFAIEGSGGVALDAPHGGTMELRWSVDFGNLPGELAGSRLAGSATLQGDRERLQVSHRLEQPFTLLTRADIDLTTDSPTLKAAGSWSAMQWPLTGATQFGSQEGTYELAADTTQVLATVSAAFAAAGIAGRINLDAAGKVEAPHAFDARIAWNAKMPDGIVAGGEGTASGDMARIELAHLIEQPLRSTLAGVIRPGSRQQMFDLHGDWQHLQWPLEGAPEYTSDSGRYTIAGSPGALDVTLDATLGGSAVPLQDAELKASTTLALDRDELPFSGHIAWQGRLPDDIGLAGGGSFEGDLRTLRLEQRLTSPFAVSASGEVALDGPALVLDLAGEWSGLRWPLTGEQIDVGSASGRWNVAGTPDAWRAGLSGELVGAGLPPASLRLSATGDGASASIDALSIATLGGQAHASGHVSWAPSIEFDVAVSAADLDFGRHWPEWPGRLGLALRANGGLAAGEPHVELALERLAGTLRGYPLKATGAIALRGTAVTIDRLAVESGRNRFAVDGEIDETIAVTFDLEAPGLESLWPGLQGAVEASGRVDGPAASPRVQASASGQRIRLDDNSVAQVTLEADVDVAAAAGSNLDLRLRDARAGGVDIESLVLAAQGGRATQEARITLRSTAVDADLALAGRYDGSDWLATLSRADLVSPQGGPWALAAPANLRLTPATGAVDLQQFCLAQASARLCARVALAAAGTIDAAAELDGLPLAVVSPWLPRGLVLDGSVKAEADIAGTVASPRASLRVTPAPGRLSFNPEDGTPLEVTWRDLRLDARLTDDVLEASAGITLEQLGQANGSVRIGAAREGAARSLSGRMDATIDDLALAAAFAPRVADTRGRVSLAADLRGTLDKPAVEGRVDLTQAGLRVPEIGIELTDIELLARNRGENLIVFDGSARSGDGTLALDGELALAPERGWPLRLQVSGKDFEVVRLAVAQARVSPDIDIRSSDGVTRVTGSIAVPHAAVRLREIPVGAVAVSGDEVMVRQQHTPAVVAAGPRMSLFSEVQVRLGDDVTFSGLGLDARLTGRLDVSTAPDRAPIGEGEIALLEARYKAYGQDLTVERSRFLFAGPLDNPGLDVRAVRRAGEVTAGLLVTGTASAPRARVFSEPALPDAEAFAYLLTGRPLSGASQSDGRMLAAAALQMGLENSATVTQRIGASLGLDELGFGADQAGNTGLVLGKYLAPDIYLSYVMGLLDGAAAVQIEYRLTDSISVQGRSGTGSQAVDLLYRFERE